MILDGANYHIRSNNSNVHYWEQDVYPRWTPMRVFRPIPDQKRGAGVEPHYHDNDEFWFFTSGYGEAWLNDKVYKITPNTIVYTPMGVVHRFQMFTEFDNLAIITPVERQRRGGHLLVEVDGPPEPTVDGYVVPGDINTGPVANRGPRNPLSELRTVELVAGEGLPEGRLATNEHWAVIGGSLHVAVDGVEADLSYGDIALLRAGAVRTIRADAGARVVLGRE